MPRGNESRLSLEDELRISELEAQASEAEEYFEKSGRGFERLLEDLDDSGEEIEFRARKIDEINKKLFVGNLPEAQRQDLLELRRRLVTEHDERRIHHLIEQEAVLIQMKGE